MSLITLFSAHQHSKKRLSKNKPSSEQAQSKTRRLTDRDLRILETVHAFDGVMSDYQIERMFFNSKRTTWCVLRQLWLAGYINRPDQNWRRRLPAMVCWLTKQGAQSVATLQGLDLDDLEDKKSFRWKEKPPSDLRIPHHLAVGDFRITVIQACQRQPDFFLEQWIPESEFWAYPDEVEYMSVKGKKARRKVRPDGFFVIRRQEKGKDNYSRLLLEIDRSTEDNPRFAREKVLPGVAYLRSEVYKKRFGYKSGRWLIVTTGERRMRNMKRQTERTAGQDAKLFYFTTFGQVSPETLLTKPIWHRGGVKDPVSLFPHIAFG